MARGTVKWFNSKNGLGMITDAEGRPVRLHFSVIKDGAFKTIQAGDQVEFEAREGRRGLEATSVAKVDGS
jgi:CspA family cold shock protein